MMSKVRLSIRAQLLFLSLFLFAIPWLGYKYVWELEEYLRIGQEQTMIGTARAIATALHEQPALFDNQSAYLQTVRPGTDLYAPPIDVPIQLDGSLNDWDNVWPLVQTYDESNVVHWFDDSFPRPTISLSFEHMVGRYGAFLYAMFSVKDDTTVWRRPSSLSIDKSDHLLIGLLNENGDLERYVISPYGSGWVNAYHLDATQNTYRAVDNELRIQGHWRQTDSGYNIELRFPLDMTSGALAFALIDVDKPMERNKRYAIGTANPNQTDALGTVLTPSPEIKRILSGLKYADSRVWVVDRHKRVLAKAGNIQSADGINVRFRPKPQDTLWSQFEQNYLLPLYYQVLVKPPSDFVDELEGAYTLVGQDITNALNGKADSLWRLTPDNKAVVLSAAYPIFIDDVVRGAVVVEQTTNGIRTLRNRALEELFHVMVAVMLLGTLSILLFANRISSRIRRLRDNTEGVIDDNGKIIGELPVVHQKDEIGDLSRSFSAVLSSLQQYNSYLENMASRLSHELRTPIAIVRSSLDTLGHVQEPEQQSQFIERAQSGLTRLSNILNSMSEATRLEHAISQEDTAPFDVAKVLTGCVEGYRHAYKDRQFVIKESIANVKVLGSDELFAQMLDKIIANAVEFSQLEDVISVHIWLEGKQLKVSVTNPGPLLPDGMKDQLVQSMVSVRPDKGNQHNEDPHLGLGLYIAQMITSFHKGHLSLSNLPDNTGVCVVITLPVVS